MRVLSISQINFFLKSLNNNVKTNAAEEISNHLIEVLSKDISSLYFPTYHTSISSLTFSANAPIAPKVNEATNVNPKITSNIMYKIFFTLTFFFFIFIFSLDTN